MEGEAVDFRGWCIRMLWSVDEAPNVTNEVSTVFGKVKEKTFFTGNAGSYCCQNYSQQDY